MSLVGNEGRREAVMRGDAVAWWAAQGPERVALVTPHGDRTYAELSGRANQLVRALRRHGLAAGDAVALMCTNRPEFVEVLVAVLEGGFRLTPINFHLTGAEAGYIAADCEARALIVDATVGDAAIDAADAAPDVTVRLSVAGVLDGFESYDDVLAKEGSEPIEDPILGFGMLYTSGTTGRPKGVHRAPVREQLPGVGNESGYHDGAVHLCTGPMYHAAPLAISTVIPLMFGATIIVMDAWDAEDTLRLIDRHKVTHTHLVPTMFHRLLSLPDHVRRAYDVSSLRLVLHGAAPCPPAEKQAIIEWFGPVVWEYYAATEGAGTIVDSATWLTKPGTVGKVNPPDQVKVGDEDGMPLPVGEVGLLWLKAPAASRFYYFKDEDKTDGSYRGDYFTLGDMGYVDEDGFLFLTDRSANLIISGGVNIYPAEVDAVLLSHAAVGDAATIGVPHVEWGESVLAVVELQPGVSASDELAAELIGWCRQHLAAFKCPRRVDFIDHLPRQDNGKVYKRLLRDRYRAAAT